MPYKVALTPTAPMGDAAAAEGVEMPESDGEESRSRIMAILRRVRRRTHVAPPRKKKHCKKINRFVPEESFGFRLAKLRIGGNTVTPVGRGRQTNPQRGYNQLAEIGSTVSIRYGDMVVDQETWYVEQHGTVGLARGAHTMVRPRGHLIETSCCYSFSASYTILTSSH